ncbi:MAG: glutaminyl-peptide cyclotransferase [Prevotellaceae bacterium]|jgi:glutamine cyclotransferase|nr:glutaminyl-peptide cyclotransferase [Prevotellaceae bacterium]
MTKVVKKTYFRRLPVFLVAPMALWAMAGCGNSKAPAGAVKQYIYRIENRYPHDAQAYTQGLFIYGGELYESTGQYGLSSLRKIDLPTGEVVAACSLPASVFAEGACAVHDTVYQLSWQERTCFLYDTALRPIGEFRYEGEGWGLTSDGVHLIMSDGSSILKFLHPADFSEVRYLNVTYEGKAIPLLNELEYIDGEIWANVYTCDYIVRINPHDGKVTGVVFMQDMLPPDLRTASTDVLNGIAYDAATKKIFVTGKNWPKLYEISITKITH